MTIGGLLIGLLVALGSGLVSRFTVQKEDASMAAFYLISLAVGVLLVSWHGSSVDLMHVLFGSVLALNDEALTLITGIALLTFLAFALLWRGLVAECLDPLFLRSVSRIAGRSISSSWCWWCSIWSAASRRSARSCRSG